MLTFLVSLFIIGLVLFLCIYIRQQLTIKALENNTTTVVLTGLSAVEKQEFVDELLTSYTNSNKCCDEM